MKHLPKMKGVMSANIKALGWHSDELFVHFKDGRLYSYANVPQQVFHEGMGADSVGTWFRQKVRGHFPHTKHEIDA